MIKKQEVVDIATITFWVLVMCMCAQGLSGCTVKFDNPFYSPTSIDVNKIESKAVNNYLTQGKQENK